MRVDKMQELFSKINTDINMDYRIKNQLLYYDIKEGRNLSESMINRFISYTIGDYSDTSPYQNNVGALSDILLSYISDEALTDSDREPVD